MTVKTLPDTSPRPNTLFDLLSPVYGLPGGSGAILAGPEQSTTIFEDAPDPRGGAWLAFSRDHSVNAAIETFRRRYGQLPRNCFDGLGGLLLVGPVPDLVEVQL